LKSDHFFNSFFIVNVNVWQEHFERANFEQRRAPHKYFRRSLAMTSFISFAFKKTNLKQTREGREKTIEVVVGKERKASATTWYENRSQNHHKLRWRRDEAAAKAIDEYNGAR